MFFFGVQHIQNDDVSSRLISMDCLVGVTENLITKKTQHGTQSHGVLEDTFPFSNR